MNGVIISKKRCLSLMALAGMLLLASCSIMSFDTTLTLTTESEEWSLVFKMLLPASDLAAFPEEVKTGFDEMNMGLEQTSQELDIEYHMEIGEKDENGNMPYLLVFEGQRYQQLNELLETEDILQLSEIDDIRTITFSWDEYYEVAESSDDFSINHLAFTLESDGQVVDTNGDTFEGSNVFWDNPGGTLYAVIQEASRFSIVSADGVLKWENNESWHYSLTFSLPAGEVASRRGDVEAFIEQQVNNERSRPGAAGVAIDWRLLETDSNGNQPYQINCSGETFSQLNAYLDEEVLQIDETDDKITHFQLSSFNAGQFGSKHATFELIPTGNVNQTNGVQQKDGSILWVNPENTMVAELESGMLEFDFSGELSNSRILLIALLCCGCMLIALAAGTAIYLILQNKKPSGPIN